MIKQKLLITGIGLSLLTGCTISHNAAGPVPLISHQAGVQDGEESTQPTNYIYGVSHAKGVNETQGANDDQ